MERKDPFSNEFTSALAELTGYIEEVTKQEQAKPQKKKSFFGFKDKEPVPRKEAAEQDDNSSPSKEEQKKTQDRNAQNHGADPSPDEQTQQEEQAEPVEDAKDEEIKKQEIVISDYGKNHLDFVKPRPRYQEVSELTPVISIKCAQEAVDAMRELRSVSRNYRRFLLVCIRDDGKRRASRYRTKEAALFAMHREMDFYINEIEPKDRTKEVYLDEDNDEKVFEPTPENEIAEDGTLKRPSEIDGTLHRIEKENRGIVFFETKNATARWDIYDMDEISVGDPDEPAYQKIMDAK